MPFLLILSLVVSACVPIVPKDVPSRAATLDTSLPAMKSFITPRPQPSRKSNAEIARDFMDLTFRLESGRTLPHFSRFEGPISVRVTGQPNLSLNRDLTRLVHRLRREAGIDIALLPSAGAHQAQTANITIEAVTREEIRRLLPQAACFVVPNVTSLAEYRRSRRSHHLNWSNITQRRHVAIFVPSDASPQEVRDCLHEEVAQSLGPLNDLYRLSDSVFNDDNVHTVLTGFDMLILRVTYDPALRTGLTRAEVARRLPAILARLNPDDGLRDLGGPHRTPDLWIAAIHTALGPDVDLAARQEAANDAVRIAAALGWRDHRRGFAHYVKGRILQASGQPLAAEQSKNEFETAHDYFRAGHDTALHQAHVAAQLGAYALAANDPQETLRLVIPAQAIAARHENAALLATLMLLRAEALDLSGRVAEAKVVRMDSLGWARYGFGADWAVQAKMRDIARLSPLKRSASY